MIRLFIIALLIAFSLPSFSQKTETYYDWQWKPCDPLVARFYGTLEKTDSGWLRNDYFIGTMKLQMRGLYKDKECEINNGDVLYFYSNGNLEAMGRSINNKQQGVCLSFHYNGVLSDSADFLDGRPKGDRFMWHSNGSLSDSIHHVNDSTDVQVSWFDNGVPSAAGHYRHDKRHGKWQYFHKNGKPAATKMFENGKMTQWQYFKEDGAPQLDTSKTTRQASYKGGPRSWQTHLDKSLYWPDGYTFAKGNMAVVVVDIFLDEDGKVEAAEIAIPFHPAFDKIALKAVMNSPAWQPAVEHGRRVKARFRQPVTFREEEEEE